jgi:hypothetical protein
MLEGLTRPIRQEEVQIGKYTVKLSWLADDRIAYIERTKNFHKKSVRDDKKMQFSFRTQNQHTKSVAWLYPKGKLSEIEIKKSIPFTRATKINLITEMKDLYIEI